MMAAVAADCNPVAVVGLAASPTNITAAKNTSNFTAAQQFVLKNTNMQTDHAV